ncbi:MAG: hypothetical protein ACREWG_07640 [Gammaproteobacteria bacterium]
MLLLSLIAAATTHAQGYGMQPRDNRAPGDRGPSTYGGAANGGARQYTPQGHYRGYSRDYYYGNQPYYYGNQPAVNCNQPYGGFYSECTYGTTPRYYGQQYYSPRYYSPWGYDRYYGYRGNRYGYANGYYDRYRPGHRVGPYQQFQRRQHTFRLR